MLSNGGEGAQSLEFCCVRGTYVRGNSSLVGHIHVGEKCDIKVNGAITPTVLLRRVYDSGHSIQCNSTVQTRRQFTVCSLTVTSHKWLHRLLPGHRISHLQFRARTHTHTHSRAYKDIQTVP